MIIYNVTVKVEKSVAKEWVEWMKQEHMPELMQTGLFVDSKLCRLLEQDETEARTYVAQYFLDNLEHYDTYIAEHAPRMREKGFKRFSDKFIAFRTVMVVE
jgi:prophage antirepressor-like protein